MNKYAQGGFIIALFGVALGGFFLLRNSVPDSSLEEQVENPISHINDNSALSQEYASSTQGFSLHYPMGYVVDDTYHYQNLGPGKDISGVKFTIPERMATGTNLSDDTYLSVEQIPQTQQCTAEIFLDQARAQTITDGDMTYSVASSTGAAAGNRYEETVYALPGRNHCIAVRYFIHYGVIENYPAGLVREFDKEALLKEFDTIRRTLKVLQ